ncbi:MAG: MucR family transcriptional regulator [Geminicoccaceae bacterium]
MTEPANDQASHHEITTLTAEIVGAYVGHHTVSATDLPDLIAMVGKGLAGLGQASAEPVEAKPTPAVSIKRSVTEDEIVCLLCGKPQKMLKRHLATRHELEPNAYKAMFGLKDDYPLVAPSYAATRSALAKKIGLGRKPEPVAPKKAPRKRVARKPAAKKG